MLISAVTESNKQAYRLISLQMPLQIITETTLQRLPVIITFYTHGSICASNTTISSTLSFCHDPFLDSDLPLQCKRPRNIKNLAEKESFPGYNIFVKLGI